MLRLYIAAVIPWLAIFGYIAYDANEGYYSSRASAKEYLEKMERVKSDKSLAAVEQATIAAIGPDASFASMFENNIYWRNKLKDRRDFALSALPVLPLGAPLLWFVFLWIAAGFRKQ